MQSIAECSDLLEAPTTGKPYIHTPLLYYIILYLVPVGSCDSGSCDLGSYNNKGSKYQEQQVEVEVFSYKFSQRERKVM